MSQLEYVILRTRGTPLEKSHTAEDILGAEEAAPMLSPNDLIADIATLDNQQYQELQNEVTVFGIAPTFPTQLVKPVSEQDQPDMDSDAATTWGVTVTGAAESPFSGAGVKVAILDTGIDASHEAFSGIELLQKDFTGEGVLDINGHGTHVAGTIFGQGGSGRRFGVAPGVRHALIAKILDSNGRGSTAHIFRAIQWAVEQGAMILNMSIGIDYPGYVEQLVNSGWPVTLATSRALQAYRDNIRLFDALVTMYRRLGSVSTDTALFVAAAGNESRRNINQNYVVDVSPPAAAEGIISVGALRTPGQPHVGLAVAPFSNANPLLSAPGVGVYSAKAGGGYTTMSGTSMAAPHVSGVVALWMEWQVAKYGRIDYSMIASRLLGRASSQRLLPSNDPTCVGAGLVQAPTSQLPQ